VSHGQLSKLAPIVRQTCKDFGVRYKSYETFGHLLVTVLRYFENLASAVSPRASNISIDATLLLLWMMADAMFSECWSLWLLFFSVEHPRTVVAG
jgi:hypothetical protein